MPRLLLITFDLTGTVRGDARYQEADAALRQHGSLFNPIKQVRLLITNVRSRRLADILEQRLGRETSILILPVRAINVWSVFDPKKQQEWRRFATAARRAGLEIRRLNPEPRGGLGD